MKAAAYSNQNNQDEDNRQNCVHNEKTKKMNSDENYLFYRFLTYSAFFFFTFSLCNFSLSTIKLKKEKKNFH